MPACQYPLPKIADLGIAKLRNRQGELFLAGELWAKQPVVVLLIRKPGCLLCRYQASELYSLLRGPLEDAGVQLVCVVHEQRSSELDEFSPAYWPGEIFQDLDKVFFKGLGGGEVVRGSAWPLLNPFSRIWPRIFAAKRKVPSFKIIGDGLSAMGGVMVLSSKSPAAHYVHVETELGLPAPLPDVLKAAQEAAGAPLTPLGVDGPSADSGGRLSSRSDRASGRADRASGRAGSRGDDSRVSARSGERDSLDERISSRVSSSRISSRISTPKAHQQAAGSNPLALS